MPSKKFSSAFVVTLLLSHTVLAPLTAVAQEQDASPQQVQKTTDSTLNESAEAAQERVGESIDNWMPDKALQVAVARALNFDDINKITKESMLGLSRLTAEKLGIVNLTGLEYAKELHILRLEDNQISDVSPLQNLTSLWELNLDNNQISDISPLHNLLRPTGVAIVVRNQHLQLQLPAVYVSNKKPYFISIESPIKNITSTKPVILSPLNTRAWTGVGQSGKVEWTGGTQVPSEGTFSTDWEFDELIDIDGINDHVAFSGTYEQPYILSKATITAHNSTIYVGDNWKPIDNFDSALDHDGNPLDFSKITVAGTVDTGRPGVYSIVYSYEGLEEKVEVTVEEKPSNSEPSKGEVTPEEKPSAPEASKGEVTPEGKPSTPEPSKGEVQSKKEKASKKLPATGEKDTKILSAIGLGILAILAILGTYISRKKRSDS